MWNWIWFGLFGLISATCCLAGLQTASEIAAIETDKYLLIRAWKWLDVIVRQLPWVGDLYRTVHNLSWELWRTYLSRQKKTVYCIQLWPIGDTNLPVRALDECWNVQSPLISREPGRLHERAWAFLPSQDYLISYEVKQSFLTMPFVAFYPKDKPAIFPPYPLRTYWKAPDLSAIQSGIWSTAGTNISFDMLRRIQECAGPLQLIDGEVNDPHSGWNWDLYQRCFPRLFVKPEHHTTTIPPQTTNMSASERRRKARIQQLTIIKSSIILTRQNQTISTITIH